MRQLVSTVPLVVLLQYFSVSAVVHAQTQTSASPSISPIQRVLAAKVMTNYPDGKFHPERSITRAELAAIVVKTFELDKRATQVAFTQPQDVPKSHWAFNYIQTVLRNDIMRGYRGNQFFPNQKITRAEAFSIVGQAFGVYQFNDEALRSILAKYPDSGKLPAWAKKPMATSLSEGFVNIDKQGKINPLNSITRGELVHAISKYLQKLGTPSTTVSAPTPIPIAAPKPAPTPIPIAAPKPTPTPIPIAAPKPTPTPIPIAAPKPAPTPIPIAAPILTPAPTYTPQPTPITAPTSVPTPKPITLPVQKTPEPVPLREIEFSIPNSLLR